MRKLSVIIPALDEEARIQDCLHSVLSARGQLPVEILVVDGGSSDRTVQRAESVPGVQVVRSVRGRARQQNAGAAAATGDILLFLHADCRLQPGALAALETLAEDTPIAPGGAFRMRFDGPGLSYRIVELLSHARLRAASVACGDQAIWVRRTAYTKVRGFPDQPLMEDVAFSRAIGRLGPLAVVEAPPVLNSARRFAANGVLRRTLSNWIISLAWAFGADIAFLKRFYPDREVPVGEAG
jgi:rSAM/selenodomain-associated transferase 2